MEDMATGEIRLSILWEWIHKGARLTAADETLDVREGDPFTLDLCQRIIAEEYEKLGRLPSTSDFGDYAGYVEGL